MTLDEIRTAATGFARTNEVVQALYQELRALNEINDRMAQEIAALTRENAELNASPFELVDEAEESHATVIEKLFAGIAY